MIIEEIRKQIKKSPISRYQISKDTGIDEAALCRIMQGRSCKVETADKLFKYFGLKVRT
jgi:predicted transcriptional regulator